jgi:elongation factor G
METILFVANALDRKGRIEEGNTVSDYDPDEIKRKMSIYASVASVEWNDYKINLIDAPGYADFAGETAGALHAVDGAIFVASAQASQVNVGFEVAWDLAVREGVSKIIFLSKMDKDNADYFRVVDLLRERFGKTIAPAEVPIGVGANFEGVVDLVHMKAYAFQEGEKVEHPEGIPDDMAEVVAAYREKLVESAAEHDDALLEKYLNGEELTTEEIEFGLRKGMETGEIAPVLCGSALKDLGVRALLDLVCEEFDYPGQRGPRTGKSLSGEQDLARKCDPNEPFSAQVFKTISDPYIGKLTFFRVYSGAVRPETSVINARTGKDERIGQLYSMRGKIQTPVDAASAGDIVATSKLTETRTGDTLSDKANPIDFDPIDFATPMYAVAVTAKSKADEDKLGAALRRLEEENPCFKITRDANTGQTLMWAAGETQVDVLVERLKRFGAQVDVKLPKAPYREALSVKAKAEGKHKKQSGGRGQFGDCWIELEPAERGSGFKFVDAVVGGAIPRQYIPAVEKGIQEAMARGVISGNPVVDVKATVYDGKFHDVDSSEAAFKIAGSLAFQNAAQLARPVLLEPLMAVKVTVPPEYMGDVIGDLNSRRGRVLGMDRLEVNGHSVQQISLVAPQRELARYAVELRAITHGRGSYTAEFSHYEVAPQDIEQEIVQEAVKNGFSPHVEH